MDMRPIMHIRQTVLGMSQKAFADAIGINQSTVSRWENGTIDPNLSELARIRDLVKAEKKVWKDAWFFDGPPPAAAAQ